MLPRITDTWYEKLKHRGKASEVLAICACLLALACGCTHRKPATIMVITPTGGLEYWEKFNHAVKAAAERAGIQTEIAAPQSVTDYTQQAQMVENAIALRVQGIIVSPAHQLVRVGHPVGRFFTNSDPRRGAGHCHIQHASHHH